MSLLLRFGMFCVVVMTLILTDWPAWGVEAGGLEVFPKPRQGMTRFVIDLPFRGDDESDRFRVELTAGKLMWTDGVNRLHLDARIIRHALQGWGYPWYEVSGGAHVAGTLMAAPPGKGRKAFVRGDSLMIRYNSRLPVVVYAPAGIQVRYRIWRADEHWRSAGRR